MLQSRRAAPVRRSVAATAVERKLNEISELFDIVINLTHRQGLMIDAVERNVDTISIRIDAARDELDDAAPRIYRTRRWRWYLQYMPQTLMEKLRACLLLILCANALFIVFVLL